MAHITKIEEHILHLVQTHKIYEQAELQRLLKNKGVDIPQATLSRRLKKLNIAKVSGVYQIIQFNLPTLPTLLNLQISESGIIVIHVHPGQANSLAYYFDQKYVPSLMGILGTIAGDDTLILIIRAKADLPKILADIKEDFPYLEI